MTTLLDFERDVFYMQSKKVDSERFFSDSLAITHTRNGALSCCTSSIPP